MSHNCQFLVFRCMDFRITSKALSELLSEIDCLEGTYDLVSVAGSGRDLLYSAGGSDFLLKQITKSIALHNIGEIIVFAHDNCGAYGISSDKEERKVQKQDLVKIKDMIIANFPDIAFQGYIIRGVSVGKLILEKVI